LNNVVSAFERWLQKSNEDPQNVFLWMCFFCNNQYRIQEEAPKGSRGSCCNMVLGQKPGALVNTKMAGEWWFIYPKCGTIGFDPFRYTKIPPEPLFSSLMFLLCDHDFTGKEKQADYSTPAVNICHVSNRGQLLNHII